MDHDALSDLFGPALDASAIFDALPRAIVITDLDGNILLWNRKAEDLYGWRAEEVLGRAVFEVLVALADQGPAEDILAGVRAGGIWSGDFTVVRKNGDRVQVWVTDRPIFDSSGKVVAILGASEDIAAQRLLERRALDLAERLRLALDAGGLGTFRYDVATDRVEVDAAVEAHFGLEPGTFKGTLAAAVEHIHPDDREHAQQTVQSAVAAKTAYTNEYRVIWPDGSVHWVHGAGQVVLDGNGDVTGVIGCTREITDQVAAEEERQRLTAEALAGAEQERLGRERLEFLGSINDALAASRNRREVMVNIANVTVPRLGDWCAVHVLPHSGALIPEIEVAHSDPSMVAYARALQDRFPFDPDVPTGMAKVMRTGTSEFYPVIDDAVLDELHATEEELEIVHTLMLRSSIAVPLIKRGRVLGGLQLIMSSSRRQYTEDDVRLAEAVASRIAASLDNLRLHDEQRSIASALQASLLPDELPDIPGVDVAVRYWANGEGVEVGGDFYDVFRVKDGTWAVVIGDVCGTGPSAAAVTGMARHTIASAAWNGDEPERVLEKLNRAMLERATERFCTVLYGTLVPSASGAQLTFTCGGHPLPVVVRADGTAATHGTYGSLIGVFEDLDLTTTTIDLGPGDTVVLYTDGATDLAPPHGFSTDEFTAFVQTASMGAASVEDIADALHGGLSAVLPIAERDDDIALLILRIP